MHDLDHAISTLTAAVNRVADNLATHNELHQINMKLSELGTNVAAIKTELTKVFKEQQDKFDALQAKYDLLVTQSADPDLSAEAAQTLTEIKDLLQAVDDTIPDPAA